MNYNQIAYYDLTFSIYWHGVVMALGILLAFFMSCALMARQRRSSMRLMGKTFLIAFPISLVLSRAQYCFFKPELYDGNFKAVFDLKNGGYALYGAMLGVVIAAAIVGRRERDLSTARVLDAIAPAGALAIAFGRAAAYFNCEELGVAVEIKQFMKFPFAMLSPYDGKWHLAAFTYECAAAAVICVVTLCVYFRSYSARGQRRRYGDTAICFMFLYSATQCLLESWRSDSLFLNSLGFVRFSQALSAIILAVLLVVLCVRYAKKYGFSPVQIVLWVVLLGLIAGAFACEFTLSSGTMIRNYLIMGTCLCAIIAIGMVLFSKTAEAPAEKSKAPAKAVREAPIMEEPVKEEAASEAPATEPAAQETPEDDRHPTPVMPEEGWQELLPTQYPLRFALPEHKEK